MNESSEWIAPVSRRGYQPELPWPWADYRPRPSVSQRMREAKDDAEFQAILDETSPGRSVIIPARFAHLLRDERESA